MQKYYFNVWPENDGSYSFDQTGKIVLNSNKEIKNLNDFFVPIEVGDHLVLLLNDKVYLFKVINFKGRYAECHEIHDNDINSEEVLNYLSDD